MIEHIKEFKRLAMKMNDVAMELGMPQNSAIQFKLTPGTTVQYLQGKFGIDYIVQVVLAANEVMIIAYDGELQEFKMSLFSDIVSENIEKWVQILAPKINTRFRVEILEYNGSKENDRRIIEELEQQIATLKEKL